MTSWVRSLRASQEAASTLDECLQSVLAQSYTDFAILMINDHSNDESEQLVTHYRKQDKRLRGLARLTPAPVAY